MERSINRGVDEVVLGLIGFRCSVPEPVLLFP